MTFPGSTALTVLDVYDWIAPDGLRGGSAHVHLASAEGYVVALGDFFAAAVRLAAGRVPQWRERWRAGALGTAAVTGGQLDRIAGGDAGYLAGGVVRRIARPAAARRYGMCGLLTGYDPAAAVSP